jgi:hypothetical protein
MDPTLLSGVFLLVMGSAVACFWRAASLRRADLHAHVRWALRGVAIDVVGTLAVFVSARFLGWTVPAAFPTVALVHRGFAYLATAMLVVQAVGGFRRWRMHPAFGVAFLGVYTVTYALAVVAYGPWWA